VIIPDGPLNAVPFAALPTVGGPLLVEEASVVVSPSLRAFRHLSAKRQAGEGVDLLVVSGVEHDPAEFPELQWLPDRWAGQQLSGWRRVRTLGGARATPGAVLAEAREATVLYFAGHAIAETPVQEGGLLLAPEVDGDGLLGFEDLRDLEPSRLELVILAACGTGTGRSSALDGPRSLVEPFLAAGVMSVVGTLWEVEDLAAAEFFDAFLDLRDQPDPVRAAQLRLLRRRPGDATWAAFQQFGAGWPAPGRVSAVVDRGD
jgi:CHAT domain-containing protein